MGVPVGSTWIPIISWYQVPPGTETLLPVKGGPQDQCQLSADNFRESDSEAMAFGERQLVLRRVSPGNGTFESISEGTLSRLKCRGASPVLKEQHDIQKTKEQAVDGEGLGDVTLSPRIQLV